MIIDDDEGDGDLTINNDHADDDGGCGRELDDDITTEVMKGRIGWYAWL